MQNSNEEQDATGQTSDDNISDDGGANTERTENDQSNAPQLNAIELRVLGVLMEKQLTTPDQYPLTLNSVITACNQKSSREPISNYNQGEVHRALQELDNKHFIRKERSSRSEKFSQQFMHHLELGRNQQAILCVLMLRGAQTLSELNTRTQRMYKFADKDELEHCIDRLCNRDVPFAIRLGQQPGQRGERISHLFCGTPTVHGSITDQNSGAPDVRSEQEQTISPAEAKANDERMALLELEVATLTASISALKVETSELKQQIAELSRLAGLTS